MDTTDPNGRAVYVANRASNADGENSLAVYTIDPRGLACGLWHAT